MPKHLTLRTMRKKSKINLKQVGWKKTGAEINRKKNTYYFSHEII